MIYLDNASTTKIAPEVFEAMMPFMNDYYGNSGTIHSLGRKSKEALENARNQVASFIGTTAEHIIFTSGGTEANNLIMFGSIDHLRSENKKEIYISSVEHDSVEKSAIAVTEKYGLKLHKISVNKNGVVETSFLEGIIPRDTGIISVMHVNNETGAENPIQQIGRYCRMNNILFATDCVQSAGGCELDVSKFGCDFLSISGHKIHAPKGVGALYARDLKKLSPHIFGGDSQEFGLRGGTANIASIVGFGKACEITRKNIGKISTEISVLKQIFYNKLKENMSDLNIADCMFINGESAVSRGKIINIGFRGVDGQTLLLMLDSRGICVSAGAACSNHETNPSKVLLSMGVNAEDAMSSIRVSFSKYNTEREIITASREIARCVKVLLKINT